MLSSYLLLLLLCSLAAAGNFTIVGDDFVKDGRPFRILSGDIHYWRMLPADWADRLAKVRALGLNCITTYVNWALHEPEPGVFDFVGPNGYYDLLAWLKAAQAADLLVILRIGPYITAETDFGGLPYWLVNYGSNITLRTTDQTYLSLVSRYFDQLVPLLAPLQYSNGGPIINFQIEDDTDTTITEAETHAYYAWLVQALRSRKIDSLINTLAYPDPTEISKALTPGTWQALELTYDTPFSLAFDLLRLWYPTGPKMVMEVYPAWFDLEGVRPHVTLDPVVFSQAMDELLSINASLSFYPVFGGTNFGYGLSPYPNCDVGFLNGAEHPSYAGPVELSPYQADATSYDYDTSMNEAGDPTEKFFTLQAVFAKYVPIPAAPVPLPSQKGSYGTVSFTQFAPLFSNLGLFTPVPSLYPLGFEPLHQAYGYVLYQTSIPALPAPSLLAPAALQDRAGVYVADVLQALIGPAVFGAPNSTTLPASTTPYRLLSLLVENKGRPSGEVMDFTYARKGIWGNVTLAGRVLTGWSHYQLPMTNLSALPLQWQASGGLVSQQPAFWRGTLNVTDTPPRPTFLLTNGWGHGIVSINDFILGRFTELGPQATLYVPASILHTGANTVILFESDSPAVQNATVPPKYRQMSSVNQQFWL